MGRWTSDRSGRTGFDVAPLALGGNVFGWTADENDVVRRARRVRRRRLQLIDTANSYSRWVTGHQGGESETVIGRWIAKRGRHDDVVIATKVGSDMGLGHKCLQARPHRRAGRSVAAAPAGRAHRPLPVALGRSGHAARRDARGVRPADRGRARCARSARRTSTPKRLARGARGEPRARRCRATRRCSRTTTCSCATSSRGRCSSCACAKASASSPYFSLAAGFLTGKYRSEADFAKSARGPGHEEVPERAGRCASWRRSRRVAERHGATLAQVALAWLMAQPGVTAPIASATSVAQLDELMAAARLKLDARVAADVGRVRSPGPDAPSPPRHGSANSVSRRPRRNTVCRRYSYRSASIGASRDGLARRIEAEEHADRRGEAERRAAIGAGARARCASRRTRRRRTTRDAEHDADEAADQRRASPPRPGTASGCRGRARRPPCAGRSRACARSPTPA